MIAEGKRAPAFNLASSEGGNLALKDLKGKIVVLYFYPKDSTPGCTVEANDFNSALPALTKMGAVVLGVSKDSIASHCKFRDKQGLRFALLSDPEGSTIEAYGAWGEKTNYGRTAMGIVRTTVIIDGQGVVRTIFPKVRVKGHVDEVLSAVKSLS